MSVAFGSALSGRKRLFEDRGGEERLAPAPGFGLCKRARQLQPLCRLPEEDGPIGGSHARQSALLKLGGMFPDVDEKIIERVLDNNGDNIEAAIAQLHQLRLSSSNPAEQQPVAHQQHLGQSTDSGPQCGPSNGSGDRLWPSWLDPFLKQFYESGEPAEAQARVARVLEEFENAIMAKCKNESEELAALNAELDKVKKGNAILSKAVSVQHSRLQELGTKDQEIQRMRDMLAQYQDRLRSLELSNYSLTMHLQRATGPPFGPNNGGPPDVC
ncbi:unnamed protein product [Ostreobium quekettii]|uniref:CUE domain-containing protein n=1 Tax=Ostreobium quekettii TaxID=121088 RepID=A0A8S1JFV3_9CHLO|nr:unnamed protein product [Ostreobium quekettii]